MLEHARAFADLKPLQCSLATCNSIYAFADKFYYFISFHFDPGRSWWNVFHFFFYSYVDIWFWCALYE